MGAFLQLFLQAVTAGVLRAVRRDAAALVRRRARSFGHASAETPAEDPQVLQVVGKIAADAFAAEAIVLAAASRIDAVLETVVDGSRHLALRTRRKWRRRRRRWRSTGSRTRRRRDHSTRVGRARRRRRGS